MNTVSNVAVGKPKIGGAIYNAPAGTALPASPETALSTAYKAMGYASEDGVTNSNTGSASEIRAWGGDVVAVPQTQKKDTFKVKLIEALNADVLKAVHGSGNVTGTLENGLSIEVNGGELQESVWIIDMILRGAAKRIVIPSGKISEIADVVYKDDTVVGYEITITCLPDASGNTHYEYIKAAAGTVSYSVSFNANGHGEAPGTQVVPSGQTASEPTAPVAAGYTFGGWYTEAACTNAYSFDAPVTGNITLYAKWTAA